MQGHTATGEKVIVKLGDKSSPSTPEAATTDNGEDRVLQILYLLDKFGVGDTFYHELSMIDKSLPRSHTVKKPRSECNSQVELQTIPGYDGVYRSFETTLQEQLRTLVCTYHMAEILLDKTLPIPATYYTTFALSFSRYGKVCHTFCA